MNEAISIYPKKELIIKLKKEMEKQKRSMNNLILLILEEYFEKCKHQ